MEDRGVLYISTGEEFVLEAQKSAESLTLHNPDLSVGIITSAELYRKLNWDDYLFDDIIEAEEVHDDIRDKAFNLKLPYDRTLYLDTDTFVCGNISDVFDILDEFDLAVTHAPLPVMNHIDGIPTSFPEVNGGVLLLRDSENVSSFISEWRTLYRKQIQHSNVRRPKHDQAPLREALYYSDLRVHFLPTEYNCRAIGMGTLRDELKILHSPHNLNGRSLAELAEVMNEIICHRSYVGYGINKLYRYQDGRFDSVNYPMRGIFEELSHSLERHGFSGTIRRIMKMATHRLRTTLG